MSLLKRLHHWLIPPLPTVNCLSLANGDTFSVDEIDLEDEKGISSALARELNRGANLFSQLEHTHEETQHLNEWSHQRSDAWQAKQHALQQQLHVCERDLALVLNDFDTNARTPS